MNSSIGNKVKFSEYNKHISEGLIEGVLASVNYCYNCNRCVNVCPLSHLNIFNPRMFIEDLTFIPLEETLNNHNIWNCFTCGQCNVYCPMNQADQGLRIPELILELRKKLRNNKTQIEKIAQCETHNGLFPLISNIMANNSINPNKLEFLKGKSLKTTDSGEIAYFIGCLPLMEELFYHFDFKYTNIAITIINLLNNIKITPVVLNDKCCGHDILWGRGDVDTFKRFAEYNTQLYRDAGVKTIIVGCAEGYRTWKFDYPKVIEDFDFKVFHFSEFFLKEGILENIRFPHNFEIKVTYHDSCRMGRLGGKLYDAPRELINQIPGVQLIEMENIKDDANCCGVSTFTNCNEFTSILRKNRIIEAVNTGADYLIVPCPKCLTHFNCYINEYSLNEDHNKLRNKIKVIDLASFIGKMLMLF